MFLYTFFLLFFPIYCNIHNGDADSDSSDNTDFKELSNLPITDFVRTCRYPKLVDEFNSVGISLLYINMDHAVDRNRRFLSMFGCLNPIRISGVDAKDPKNIKKYLSLGMKNVPGVAENDEGEPVWNGKDRRILKNENINDFVYGVLGCTLSHLLAAEKVFEDKSIKYAIIMEDDMTDELVPYWHPGAFQNLLELLPIRWSCVQLSLLSNQGALDALRDVSYGHDTNASPYYLIPGQWLASNGAYLVSRQGVTELMQALRNKLTKRFDLSNLRCLNADLCLMLLAKRRYIYVPSMFLHASTSLNSTDSSIHAHEQKQISSSEADGEGSQELHVKKAAKELYFQHFIVDSARKHTYNWLIDINLVHNYYADRRIGGEYKDLGSSRVDLKGIAYGAAVLDENVSSGSIVQWCEAKGMTCRSWESTNNIPILANAIHIPPTTESCLMQLTSKQSNKNKKKRTNKSWKMKQKKLGNVIDLPMVVLYYPGNATSFMLLDQLSCLEHVVLIPRVDVSVGSDTSIDLEQALGKASVEHFFNSSFQHLEGSVDETHDTSKSDGAFELRLLNIISTIVELQISKSLINEYLDNDGGTVDTVWYFLVKRVVEHVWDAVVTEGDLSTESNLRLDSNKILFDKIRKISAKITRNHVNIKAISELLTQLKVAMTVRSMNHSAALVLDLEDLEYLGSFIYKTALWQERNDVSSSSSHSFSVSGGREKRGKGSKSNSKYIQLSRVVDDYSNKDFPLSVLRLGAVASKGQWDEAIHSKQKNALAYSTDRLSGGLTKKSSKEEKKVNGSKKSKKLSIDSLDSLSRPSNTSVVHHTNDSRIFIESLNHWSTHALEQESVNSGAYILTRRGATESLRYYNTSTRKFQMPVSMLLEAINPGNTTGGCTSSGGGGVTVNQHCNEKAKYMDANSDASFGHFDILRQLQEVRRSHIPPLFYKKHLLHGELDSAKENECADLDGEKWNSQLVKKYCESMVYWNITIYQ